MIDTAEYDRFLEAEARYHDRPLKEDIPQIVVNQVARRPPDKHGNQPILKYDYFLHPRFGVVKALNDGGTLVCKSPVCEALDRELFE